ncbi:UNKNOWN [Stylonychia lemnae]|uniref:Uncharacterized protein n=1 Tax=Stylonychia lemnae TaxID=5949 RepID=A0A078AHZ5_STYLE|nr:UNKNOWN [Stylonychia lemnae]|eukprot:CDW81869.1 UNKNOWN [Stylonychia lemnae]
MIPLIIKVYQSNGNVIMMGIQQPSANDFNIFVTWFDESFGFQIAVYSANSLAYYNAIISQMEENLLYVVGCIESLNADSALIGMFLHKIGNPQANILFRNAFSYDQRKFECLGIKFLQLNEITLVYSATFNSIPSYFIVSFKEDPFIPTTVYTVSEQWLRRINTNTIRVYQFKYVSTKNDFFYLGQLIESSGQQRAFLSQLSTTDTYYSIIEDYKPINDDIYTYSTEYNEASNTDYGDQPDITDILEKPLIKVFENLLPYVGLWKNQNNKASSQIKVSQLQVYQDRPPNNLTQNVDCYLGPDQSCFKQTLTLVQNIRQKDFTHILFWDRLDDFQVGILADSANKIDEYEFLFNITVGSEIENFISKPFQTYSFKFQVHNKVGQFSIINSAPYFLSSVLDIEVNVGVLRIIDLPIIRDDEGDDYTVSIKGKKAGLFVSATNKKLIINPISSVVGMHQVNIILKDNNRQIKQKKYLFQILVKPDVTSYFESLLKDTNLKEDFKKSQVQTENQASNPNKFESR